jgi:hypothetical protein
MTPNRPDLYAIDRFQLAAKLRQICRMKDSFTYDVLVVEKPGFRPSTDPSEHQPKSR